MADLENPTRYVIIGMARSGTTVTSRALTGHRNVMGPDDEFKVHPFFTEGMKTFTVGGPRFWERERNAYKLFDAVTIYHDRTPDPSGALAHYCGTPDNPKGDVMACGFKVAIAEAAEAEQLVESLQRFYKQLRIIWVRRRDWVAQFASLEKAKVTGGWHSWSEKNQDAPTEFEFSVDGFRYYFDDGVRTEQAFEQLRATHEVCEFVYEDDITGGRWARLFEFLDVPVLDPFWLSSKKVSPPIEDYVKNAAELRAEFARLRG